MSACSDGKLPGISEMHLHAKWRPCDGHMGHSADAWVKEIAPVGEGYVIHWTYQSGANIKSKLGTKLERLVSQYIGVFTPKLRDEGKRFCYLKNTPRKEATGGKMGQFRMFCVDCIREIIS